MGLDANAERFTGFADLYDTVRPTPPLALAEVLRSYAGGAPVRQVVDLGSGTGLSTRWAGSTTGRRTQSIGSTWYEALADGASSARPRTCRRRVAGQSTSAAGTISEPNE